MTAAPSDLSTFRIGVVIPLTGLTGNDVGIAPDASHLSSGGYHVGCEDIQSIGKWNTDYSTRQARDRLDGTNDASAMDIGDDWPRGGRAAWLRFNNLLVAQLRAADPALGALRAVNFSPDGTARKRYDSFNPAQGVVDSTDSVYMHTHLEWWRNTVGTAARSRSLARIGQIIDAAIRNVPLPPEGDDMALSDIVHGTKTANVSGDRNLETTIADMYITLRANLEGEHDPRPGTPMAGLIALAKGAPQLLAATAADEQRDNAALAAITALSTLVQQGGGNVDSAGIIAAVHAVGDDTHAQVVALHEQVADLQQQMAAVQARNVKLAAALAAAGGALDAADD